MSASAASDVWPAIPWNDEALPVDDFEGIRGLLYSLAISLVFVWAPIGFFIYGMTLISDVR